MVFLRYYRVIDVYETAKVSIAYAESGDRDENCGWGLQCGDPAACPARRRRRRADLLLRPGLRDRRPRRARRTTTGCCVSTSRRTPIYRSIPPTSWPSWPPRSTTDPARCWVGRPLGRSSPRCGPPNSQRPGREYTVMLLVSLRPLHGVNAYVGAVTYFLRRGPGCGRRGQRVVAEGTLGQGRGFRGGRGRGQMSVWVEVWPREKRRAERAWDSVRPSANST